MLSARTEPTDKIAALDAGSDDHISKPFAIDELLARVRAGLRRGLTGPGDSTTVRTASFTADLAARTVTLADGTSTHLTPTEWHLLEELTRHRRRLCRELARGVSALLEAEGRRPPEGVDLETFAQMLIAASQGCQSQSAGTAEGRGDLHRAMLRTFLAACPRTADA